MKPLPNEEYESPELEAAILEGINSKRRPLTEATYNSIRKRAQMMMKRRQTVSMESFGKPKRSKS